MTTTASEPLVAQGALRGRTWPLSVAPMMERTDRHFRVFLRGLTRHTLLYTEMITTGAVLHGDREQLLGFSAVERPLALQLGGDEPAALAAAARLAAELGYDEIDLNVGCPSSRVQSGSFGACLMARPERVAAAVAALRAAVTLPVTVKHRIGIDDRDSYEDLLGFVDTVAAAGCDRFIVHARKAILAGLSPKENREVPPLRYELVLRLKRERPWLRIEINGGIRSLDQAAELLAATDGVMIGRAAYDDPYLFAAADQRFYASPGPVPSRQQALASFLPYVEEQRRRGVPLGRLSRHLLSLFAGQRGGRRFRRYLAEHAHRPGAGPEVLARAAAEVALSA